MRYGHAVIADRFEPFHLGHLAVFDRAFDMAREVVALVEGAETARSPAHPFSFAERETMMRAALGGRAGRVTVLPLYDHFYCESAWAAEAQEKLASIVGPLSRAAGSLALVVADEGRARRLAGTFPQADVVEAEAPGAPGPDDLRRSLFSEEEGAFDLIAGNTPPPVTEFLRAFRATPDYAAAREEFRFIEDYRAAWDAAPFPPVFVTVDAVVAHSGHLLLVRRKGPFGRGLWALPGGFVDRGETLLDAVLRELGEETALEPNVLPGAMRARQVFDRPDRSLRGRTITHAFYFDIPRGPLPAIRAGDDAASAAWICFAEVRKMRAVFFEDHFSILEHFLCLKCF